MTSPFALTSPPTIPHNATTTLLSPTSSPASLKDALTRAKELIRFRSRTKLREDGVWTASPLEEDRIGDGVRDFGVGESARAEEKISGANILNTTPRSQHPFRIGPPTLQLPPSGSLSSSLATKLSPRRSSILGSPISNPIRINDSISPPNSAPPTTTFFNLSTPPRHSGIGDTFFTQYQTRFVGSPGRDDMDNRVERLGSPTRQRSKPQLRISTPTSAASWGTTTTKERRSERDGEGEIESLSPTLGYFDLSPPRTAEYFADPYRSPSKPVSGMSDGASGSPRRRTRHHTEGAGKKGSPQQDRLKKQSSTLSLRYPFAGGRESPTLGLGSPFTVTKSKRDSVLSTATATSSADSVDSMTLPKPHGHSARLRALARPHQARTNLCLPPNGKSMAPLTPPPNLPLPVTPTESEGHRSRGSSLAASVASLSESGHQRSASGSRARMRSAEGMASVGLGMGYVGGNGVVEVAERASSSSGMSLQDDESGVGHRRERKSKRTSSVRFSGIDMDEGTMLMEEKGAGRMIGGLFDSPSVAISVALHETPRERQLASQAKLMRSKENSAGRKGSDAASSKPTEKSKLVLDFPLPPDRSQPPSPLLEAMEESGKEVSDGEIVLDLRPESFVTDHQARMSASGSSQIDLRKQGETSQLLRKRSAMISQDEWAVAGVTLSVRDSVSSGLDQMVASPSDIANMAVEYRDPPQEKPSPDLSELISSTPRVPKSRMRVEEADEGVAGDEVDSDESEIDVDSSIRFTAIKERVISPRSRFWLAPRTDTDSSPFTPSIRSFGKRKRASAGIVHLKDGLGLTSGRGWSGSEGEDDIEKSPDSVSPWNLNNRRASTQTRSSSVRLSSRSDTVPSSPVGTYPRRFSALSYSSSVTTSSVPYPTPVSSRNPSGSSPSSLLRTLPGLSGRSSIDESLWTAELDTWKSTLSARDHPDLGVPRAVSPKSAKFSPPSSTDLQHWGEPELLEGEGGGPRDDGPGDHRWSTRSSASRISSTSSLPRKALSRPSLGTGIPRRTSHADLGSSKPAGTLTTMRSSSSIGSMHRQSATPSTKSKASTRAPPSAFKASANQPATSSGTPKSTSSNTTAAAYANPTPSPGTPSGIPKSASRLSKIPTSPASQSPRPTGLGRTRSSDNSSTPTKTNSRSPGNVHPTDRSNLGLGIMLKRPSFASLGRATER